jgi:long-chain acyl-CoA synthetase
VLARAEAEGRLEALRTWQGRLRRLKQLTGVNLGPLIFRPLHKALGGRIRFLVSGGAALNPRTALDFFSLGLPLLQGWGMTEAAPTIAVQRFSARRFRFSRHYERHAGSVGPALPGVEVRLIDVPEKGIHAADGEGEVLVRGPNLFHGYWQADDATQAAMHDGWLRTGDLARIDRDGNIYLTGRSKYVIVLESGEKVHPDEIEEKLHDSAIIEDVCVTGRKPRDKTQVTAIVYAGVAASLDRLPPADRDASGLQRLVDAEIEAACGGLATYKRVSRIELTDQPLPKTPLRKVARGQLTEAYTFDFERWLASEESVPA